MTSYFSQIQYVPDPITGERVNIGIVVIDSNGCQFQFVQDWRRPSQFGGEDVGFLREFAEEASRDGSGWFVAAGAAPSESLSHALSRWHNKIQFSPPMPSIKNRNDLINELAPRILHLSAEIETEDAARHKGRGREKAISTAVRSLGNAMREKFGRAPRGLVQRHINVPGRIESHELHLGLKNGTLYGGAFAVSFETGSPRSQQRDTDAIAFALEDIRAPAGEAQLAVIVLPPSRPSRTYDRARHIFRSLDAPILAERNLPNWASKLVERLPEDLLAEQRA